MMPEKAPFLLLGMESVHSHHPLQGVQAKQPKVPTFACCCFSPNSVERFMTSCGARISHTERAPLHTMTPFPPTALLSAAGTVQRITAQPSCMLSTFSSITRAQHK